MQVQAMPQTQQTLGDLDTNDDLDDINLDHLVSNWQARRAQLPAPASAQHQPFQRPLTLNTQQPQASLQAPSSSRQPFSNHNHNHPPSSLRNQTPAAHSAANGGQFCHDQACDNLPMSSGLHRGSATGRPTDGVAAAGQSVGSMPANSSSLQRGRQQDLPRAPAVEARGSTAGSSLTGLDPALRTVCCHGVPLGSCQHAEQHLGSLKDELIQVCLDHAGCADRLLPVLLHQCCASWCVMASRSYCRCPNCRISQQCLWLNCCVQCFSEPIHPNHGVFQVCACLLFPFRANVCTKCRCGLSSVCVFCTLCSSWLARDIHAESNPESYARRCQRIFWTKC